MDKKENFKTFVSRHPTLSDYIEDNTMTWQKFYELYDLYGEDNPVWDKYLKPKDNTRGIRKEDIITELTNLVKGIDLDSIQNHVNNAQKAINIIQELTKTQVLIEIEKDQKLHAYLKSHSRWYLLLNRDANSLNSLKKEYKEYKRNNTMKKVDETVDNIELLTNIMKIV